MAGGRAMMMLARTAGAATEGSLADFHLTGEEWYEVEVAGGLPLSRGANPKSRDGE
jgi:hypothetical protein